MTIPSKLLIFLSMGFLISCSGGNNPSNTNEPSEIVSNSDNHSPNNTNESEGSANANISTDFQPIHDALTYEESVHRFYNGKILPDGQLIVSGVVNSSNSSTLLTTGPDTSRFTPLVPRGAQQSQFAAPDYGVYVFEQALYSYSRGASNPVKLSETEVVRRFWLSPDQTKVLYIANYASERITDATSGRVTYKERNELYIVNVAGGGHAKLSISDSDSKIQYLRNVSSSVPHRIHPQFLPDMSRVIYVVTVESTGNSELHSVLLDGTGRTVLNENLMSGNSEEDEGDLTRRFVFTFTSNSSHVIYGVKTDDVMELYSIAPDGSGNVKISGSLVAGGSVSSKSRSFTAISSPDNSYVVFLAYADTANISELYRVGLDGSGRTKLSNGTRVLARKPLFTEDGTTLVYFSDAIYSVSSRGGDSINMISGLNRKLVYYPILTADQLAVVYAAKDQDSTIPKIRLYLSKLDGSSTVDLSGTMIDNGKVLGGKIHFMLDPAGERVVFRANADVSSDYALYAVNLDGSNRIKLTPDRKNTRYRSRSKIFGFAGNQFYFSFDRDTSAFDELYVYDFNESLLKNISASWPKFITEDVRYYKQSIDGLVQAFSTDISAYREKAIIAVTATGSCRIELLADEDLVKGSSNFALEPSGAHLYYTLRDTTSAVSGDWTVYKASTTDCSASPISEGITTEKVSRFKASPDGKLIAFSGSTNNAAGLYITKNDGSGVVELNADRAVGGIIRLNNGAFAFSHDSKSVVYWGDEDTAGVTELYAVTVDGLTRNKINGQLVSNGRVFKAFGNFTPQLSADNQWVVYQARQDLPRWELYKSKLDGSDNEKISGILEDAQVFNTSSQELTKITADSSKVVYLVRDSSGINIYSVNLNGDPVPVKLNPDFSGVGRVATSYRLTPDSKSVVYMLKDDVYSPTELFASALDGSSSIKLNTALLSGAEVINFSLTADGKKVVYHTTTQDENITQLYVSNIDGSGKILLATPEGVDTIYSSAPRLTTANRVVFRTVIDEIDGFYVQPLSGGEVKLIFEIPNTRAIREAYVVGNNQLRVIADLRLQYVYEVFHFEM